MLCVETRGGVSPWVCEEGCACLVVIADLRKTLGVSPVVEGYLDAHSVMCWMVVGWWEKYVLLHWHVVLLDVESCFCSF